jgi:cystathionine beta-lyase
MPGVMSHASIPEEVRKARSFPEDLIRLSIGIEEVQDLIQDLQRALQSFVHA